MAAAWNESGKECKVGNLSRSELVLSLFERYYDRVQAFARRSVSAGQAEDIAQEVFIRLMEVEELERMSISISYLLKIADNLIKRGYQRSQRFNRFLQSSAHASDPVDDACVARQGIQLENRDLASALSRLSDNERDAVVFIVCEGMSYETAARTMGVSVTTVNNWKFRALRKLKDMARSSTGGLTVLLDRTAAIDSDASDERFDSDFEDCHSESGSMTFERREVAAVAQSDQTADEVLEVPGQPGLRFHRPIQIPA